MSENLEELFTVGKGELHRRGNGWAMGEDFQEPSGDGGNARPGAAIGR